LKGRKHSVPTKMSFTESDSPSHLRTYSADNSLIRFFSPTAQIPPCSQIFFYLDSIPLTTGSFRCSRFMNWSPPLLCPYSTSVSFNKKRANRVSFPLFLLFLNFSGVYINTPLSGAKICPRKPLTFRSSRKFLTRFMLPPLESPLF